MVLKQTKGFTLLEMLISFSCFLVLISLLPIIINGMHIPKHLTGNWLKPMEVHLFFEQVGLELRQTRSLTNQWGRLLLTKDDGSVVTIERYGNYIRRRVNNKGHDVMLTNVKSMTFRIVSNGVEIQVTGLNGSKYQKRISLTPYRES
ncbi:hypothetical protein CIB95_04620 [Lottiidibacillus patelloidae]|uniref:Competence protein ComGF n=1 Tax=Lottiidibacillus patelloidae TaxID=2670334 RepID=A0A263BVB8_9BACI|nr:competence type IV pilus minor pilin ComGF [Lottiidibacillus patelloidae]OZM57659.1 hypothetical protein CIB95_04620 [Lottiidibacillus patelloidae]